MRAIKRLKIIRLQGANGAVNEFLKFSGSEARNKLLKITNITFEKGKVPSDSRRP